MRHGMKSFSGRLVKCSMKRVDEMKQSLRKNGRGLQRLNDCHSACFSLTQTFMFTSVGRQNQKNPNKDP